MSNLTLIGVAIYMAGHGIRGLPSGGLGGSVLMVIGGVLLLVGLAV